MNYSIDKEIHDVCREYGIMDYTINIDGSIDVDDDVFLYNKGLTKLPMKFNHVSGNFNCSGNNLTTLEFSPQTVGGYFDCGYNNLTTLLGGPQSVDGDFYCSYNPIHNQLGFIDYKLIEIKY